MLWHRYDQDRADLDMYSSPRFATGSGIADRETISRELLRIDDEMKGQPHPLIKARAFAFLLQHGAVFVNPKCWFGFNIAGIGFGVAPYGSKNTKNAGQPEKPLNVLCHRWLREIPCPEPVQAAMANLWETGTGSFWADYSHSVPDWDAILKYGFRGLLDRARTARCRREREGTLTEDGRVFFESVEITYLALIRFMHRLTDIAEQNLAADERMPLRARCLRSLTEQAPQDIYQAMQLIYAFHLIQQYVEAVQARSFGDLDRLLYPYFLADVQRGTFSPEQIKELFKYWFIQYDFQNHPYNQPMSVGGSDVFGQPVANELSSLILDAYYEADIINLKIHVVVSEKTPDAFLKKSLDMIRRGRGSFVYMNEQVGLEAMTKSRGFPVRPHELGTWGCFNFNTKGGVTDVLHVRLNLAKPIELALNNGLDLRTGVRIGCASGDVEAMRSFADFEQAFYQQLDDMVDKAFLISDFYDRHIMAINPAPMDSATLQYSVDSARDGYTVGVTNIVGSCIGTPADSLAMLKKVVFDRQAVSLTQMRDILRNDWQGQEKLRAEIVKDPDKYGNNRDPADRFAAAIARHLVERIAGRPNQRNGTYQVGGSSIDYNIRYGERTGATPDGRRAGSPLSKNVGPSIGTERSGITATIQSVTKLPAADLPGGAPLDFLLHPSAVQGAAGLDAFLAMIRVFMRQGGYAIQGNVVDAETLRAAQRDPEKYRGLQVRVTGWNWYFNDVIPQYQEELIRRVESQY